MYRAFFESPKIFVVDGSAISLDSYCQWGKQAMFLREGIFAYLGINKIFSIFIFRYEILMSFETSFAVIAEYLKHDGFTG